MVERFNDRVATEVLQFYVSSHENLEILLRGSASLTIIVRSVFWAA